MTAAPMAAPRRRRPLFSGAGRRIALYACVGLGLALLLVPLQGSTWRGNVELHTLMEAIATLLAATVGAMALVRFYTQKNNTILFIGAGFLGTAFLDGYHAIVTSALFEPYMPTDLASLSLWSWVASRVFLSIFLFLSLLAWLQERAAGEAGRIRQMTVYVFTVVFTYIVYLFFSVVPLPPPFYPDFIFHRPEEFGPALFFLLALIGYLGKGHWRDNSFEHWVLLSLIVGFVGQAVFMSHSGLLFDYQFETAHLLKIASYICVLIGLLSSMYEIFRREVDASQRIRAVVDNIVDGIIATNERGIIQSINPAAERIFGWRASEIIGRHVGMLTVAPAGGTADHLIADHLRAGRSRAASEGREVVGRRRDGRAFPMELHVAQVRFTDERLFVVIVRDITERKEMDRMKNEFISVVSHELRTPLTSIVGSLGLLRGGVVGKLSHKADEMIDIAYNNSDRLVRLINDILDIDKIESGKLEFREEILEVTPLVERAVEANKGIGEPLDVSFAVTETLPGAYIRGDGDRLIQVVTNLLSNAAKFSPPGGQVDVAVTRVNGRVRVSVTDHGPGLPAEFRDHAFEKFAQADSSDDRVKGGTGLGLSICKLIVERLGGDIGFTTREGAGATFYFELPEVDHGAARAAAASSTAEIGDRPAAAR